MNNRSMLPEQEAQLLKDYVSGQIPSRRTRSGLGCLVKPLLVLILGIALLLLVRVALNPWVLFLGGDFHPLGYWSGWGLMHSRTAGDYFLYVEISAPTRSGRSPNIGPPHTGVQGQAHLCTPRGERFSLRLYGEMPPHIYLHTVGEPILLGMHNWRVTLPVGRETRPTFSLWGRWGKGEIVADDHQTLSKAFLPDGTLRPERSRSFPSGAEDIQLTLHEGTYSQWEAACAQARRSPER